MTTPWPNPSLSPSKAQPSCGTQGFHHYQLTHGRPSVTFLLNFQGYRPETDTFVELSLCRQLEKESTRLLQEIPIAQVTAAIGRRSNRDPLRNKWPSPTTYVQPLDKRSTIQSPGLVPSLREVRLVRRAIPPEGRITTQAERVPAVQQVMEHGPTTGTPHQEHNQQQPQIHNIANQQQQGSVPSRRCDYPPQQGRSGGTPRGRGQGRAPNSPESFTACSMAKTQSTQPEIAQKPKTSKTAWLEPPPQTIKELSPTHITLINTTILITKTDTNTTPSRNRTTIKGPPTPTTPIPRKVTTPTSTAPSKLATPSTTTTTKTR